MSGEVEPAELAQLLDLAERPRAHNWSLRAALTRYAQPQPQRASDLIELLRRIEFALRPYTKLFERDGPAVWAALVSGEPSAVVDPFVVDLLRAMVEIDRLGEAIAAWAVDRSGERPDEPVDAVVDDVTRRLEALGVPREERPRPTGRRA